MTDIISTVKTILKEQGHENMGYHVETVACQIHATQRNIVLKTRIYKWSAFIVLLFIPVMSATLSIFVSENLAQIYTKTLSYSLTVLALLNSIFRPGDRFRELCDMGINIQGLEDEFVTSLQMLGMKDLEETHLIEICDKFERQLVPIEKRLIGMFLPDTPAKAGETLPQHKHA